MGFFESLGFFAIIVLLIAIILFIMFIQALDAAIVSKKTLFRIENKMDILISELTKLNNSNNNTPS